MRFINTEDNRPLDLITLGRAGIDFNTDQLNCPLEEASSFTRTVGGSPANIAVGGATLSLNVGFIGKVANNGLGRYIVNYFHQKGIDTTNVIFDMSNAVNGLAITEIRSPRDCGAVFYRDNVADLNLTASEINEDYIKKSKILLVSGTALARSPSREAVFTAIEYAKRNNVFVALDIDYRPYTWGSLDEVAVYYNLVCEKCDLIIGNKEEFDLTHRLFTPENCADSTSEKRWLNHNAKIVVVKHGKTGSVAYTREQDEVRCAPFPARLIKTFGAGDAYAAAFLYGLVSGLELSECMKIASASASIVISKVSCSVAMPTVEEIYEYIQRCQQGEIVET